MATYLGMLLMGGAGLVLMSLSGHLHFDHDLHLGEHEGAEIHLGHAEAHVEGHDVHVGAGELPFTFSFLSPFVALTLVTFVGLVGFVCRRSGMAGPVTLLPSSASGLGVAWLTLASLNWALRKAQGSSTFREDHVAGLEAEVITPIPEGGLGEIAFRVKGARRTAPARAEGGLAIAKHTQVLIVDHEGAAHVVRPTQDERLRALDRANEQ